MDSLDRQIAPVNPPKRALSVQMPSYVHHGSFGPQRNHHRSEEEGNRGITMFRREKQRVALGQDHPVILCRLGNDGLSKDQAECRSTGACISKNTGYREGQPDCTGRCCHCCRVLGTGAAACHWDIGLLGPGETAEGLQMATGLDL